MMRKIKAFIRFSRPHTVVGTTLSITGLWVLAQQLGGGAWDPGLWLLTLLSCLGANIYIVGLNQLTDIGIDRVNKPQLPLASGAFSRAEAWTLIGVSLVAALYLAFWLGPWLAWTVGLSLALGTIYSLPPVRLKRFPFWAAFCIIAVRGLIVNVLLFFHFRVAAGGAPELPPVVWVLVGLMFVYGLVIAFFKDMPDTQGDQLYAIQTFSLRWGVASVFRRGNQLLSLALLGVIVAAALFDLEVNAPWLIAAHLLILGALYAVSSRVRLSEQAAIVRYYQFIWRLFFAEYIVFALAALMTS